MDTNIELRDGNLLLRPPRPDDASAIAAAVQESLPELHPWMDWASETYDEAAASLWVERSQLGWEHATTFHFVMIHAETGMYLGNCGMDGIHEKYRFGNLGYWVRTSHTRQGFASRAIRLSARFAFETIKLVRAELVIAAGNIPSQRTALKAGAHYEGIMINRMVVREDVSNAMIYSLTPADFFGLPSLQL
jgi:ribosomal-protein-serine acetyltransferase